MIARAKRNERGMTLIEVIVSMAILVTVGLGMSQLLVMSLKVNKLAQERSVATGLASARTQQITAMQYQSSVNSVNYKLPEETATGAGPYTFTSDYGVVPGNPNFKRVVTLTYNSPVSGMLCVQTLVYWKTSSQNGVEKNHEMVVYLQPQLLP